MSEPDKPQLQQKDPNPAAAQWEQAAVDAAKEQVDGTNDTNAQIDRIAGKVLSNAAEHRPGSVEHQHSVKRLTVNPDENTSYVVAQGEGVTHIEGYKAKNNGEKTSVDVTSTKNGASGYVKVDKPGLRNIADPLRQQETRDMAAKMLFRASRPAAKANVERAKRIEAAKKEF